MRTLFLTLFLERLRVERFAVFFVLRFLAVERFVVRRFVLRFTTAFLAFFRPKRIRNRLLRLRFFAVVCAFAG